MWCEEYVSSVSVLQSCNYLMHIITQPCYIDRMSPRQDAVSDYLMSCLQKWKYEHWMCSCGLLSGAGASALRSFERLTASCCKISVWHVVFHTASNLGLTLGTAKSHQLLLERSSNRRWAVCVVRMGEVRKGGKFKGKTRETKEWMGEQ